MGALLVLGAVAALAAIGSSASASESGGSGGGGGGGGGGDGCVDPSMPAKLREEVEKALAVDDLAPADYEKLAAAMKRAGYPMAAKCLSQKAKDRRAELEAELARLGGMPHVIRTGDIPSIMARYYTGDPMRFRDLPALNPQIGTLKTVNGVSNYPGWIVGRQILIPASWNPLDKPLPPPATGSVAVPKPAPEPEPEDGPGWIEQAQAALEEAASDAKQGATVLAASSPSAYANAAEQVSEDPADGGSSNV